MKAKEVPWTTFFKLKKYTKHNSRCYDVTAKDIVLEIGPGKGSLTEILTMFAGKVVAVEKDRELIGHLKEKFKEAIKYNRLEILEEDILDFDPNIISFIKILIIRWLQTYLIT